MEQDVRHGDAGHEDVDMTSSDAPEDDGDVHALQASRIRHS